VRVFLTDTQAQARAWRSLTAKVSAREISGKGGGIVDGRAVMDKFTTECASLWHSAKSPVTHACTMMVAQTLLRQPRLTRHGPCWPHLPSLKCWWAYMSCVDRHLVALQCAAERKPFSAYTHAQHRPTPARRTMSATSTTTATIRAKADENQRIVHLVASFETQRLRRACLCHPTTAAAVQPQQPKRRECHQHRFTWPRPVRRQLKDGGRAGAALLPVGQLLVEDGPPQPAALPDREDHIVDGQRLKPKKRTVVR